MCKDAGLEGVDTYTLKHTGVSMAIASGADVYAVQRMCGHADASTTLNVSGTKGSTPSPTQWTPTSPPSANVTPPALNAAQSAPPGATVCARCRMLGSSSSVLSSN